MSKSKAARRRSRDYWNRKKHSKVQANSPAEPEKLTQSEPIAQQGLRLPAASQGKLYLMEAEDGTLADVPEAKLDDWMEMQGQEAMSAEEEEKEGELVELVLQMLYGGAEPGK